MGMAVEMTPTNSHRRSAPCWQHGAPFPAFADDDPAPSAEAGPPDGATSAPICTDRLKLLSLTWGERGSEQPPRGLGPVLPPNKCPRTWDKRFAFQSFSGFGLGGRGLGVT